LLGYLELILYKHQRVGHGVYCCLLASVFRFQVDNFLRQQADGVGYIFSDLFQVWPSNMLDAILRPRNRIKVNELAIDGAAGERALWGHTRRCTLAKSVSV